MDGVLRRARREVESIVDHDVAALDLWLRLHSP